MMNKISSPKILLVDDQPENLFYLETILKEENKVLIKSSSGKDALKKLETHDIALILLDVQMPEINGFETASKISNSKKTKDIPIIFVSAFNKEVFKGYKSGAVDFISTPLDPDILKSKVNVFLELSQKRKALEEKTNELETAKKNTDQILKNVMNGIFLLDQNYNIKSQYSSALEEILMKEQLDNLNLITYLENKILKEQLRDARLYLELMFKKDISEDAVLDLNPLSEIEINFHHSIKEKKSKKILSFIFKRIMACNGVFKELIVTVTDITEKVLLRQKLDESEVDSKNQMEWLFNILHVEPTLLIEFLESVENELNTINQLLKADEEVINYNEKLTDIFRAIHLIKGNAGLLDLKLFVEKAHFIEETIIDVQKKQKIDGNAFISLAYQVTEMRSVLNKFNNLINRIGNIQTHFRPKRKHECILFVQSLESLIKNTARGLKKNVKFLHENFDPSYIPYNYRLPVKEILIQLIKNSIYHGIEKAGARTRLNKKPFGTIELTSSIKNNILVIKYSDDGIGLQIDKIHQKAKDSLKWNKEDVDKWTEKQVMNAIFTQGITTSEKTDFIVGRGVGMDVINDKVNKLNGQIEVNSEVGQYCEFIITINLN